MRSLLAGFVRVSAARPTAVRAPAGFRVGRPRYPNHDLHMNDARFVF